MLVLISIIYFFIKLPFNLSVLCTSHNEGFSFAYGNYFLLKHQLCEGRGLLFILFHALIVKMFGFNTFSIIVGHTAQTFIVILISILIYLIVNQVLKNNLSGVIAVLIWMILIIAPLGSSLKYEILANLTLEPEYFCVLFSLFSILCLIKANLIFNSINSSFNIKESIFLFLAGFFAISSGFFKASGLALSIAMFIWIFIVFIFSKQIELKSLIKKVFWLIGGFIGGLILFYFLLRAFNQDIFSYFMDNVLIGSYSHNYLTSLNSFFKCLKDFMFRHSTSYSNFILFLFVFVLFVWGFLRLIFKRSDPLSKFWLFVSIWGFISMLAVVSPGSYQPYYYHLVWVPIAIVFVLGINDLHLVNNKTINILIAILLSMFFGLRLFFTIPAYIEIIKQQLESSIFNQPQSFQDPVLPYDFNLTKRNGFLHVADEINNLLSNKTDTFYIFNFQKEGLTALTPITYLYAKRYPPTAIICGLLHVETLFKSKLKALKKDLIDTPPKLLIISKDIYMFPWQVKSLTSFLKWFNSFIDRNYNFKIPYVVRLQDSGKEKVETFLFFERKK